MSSNDFFPLCSEFKEFPLKYSLSTVLRLLLIYRITYTNHHRAGFDYSSLDVQQYASIYYCSINIPSPLISSNAAKRRSIIELAMI